MYITPINNHYRHTHFKGLWAKDMQVGADILKEYYPFLDDKPEKIKEVLKRNTHSQIDPLSESGLDVIQTIARVARVIPIKFEEYKNYALNFTTMKKRERRRIEKILEANELFHYIKQ